MPVAENERAKASHSNRTVVQHLRKRRRQSPWNSNRLAMIAVAIITFCLIGYMMESIMHPHPDSTRQKESH